MTLKKEIEDILHPPRAPIISEKSVDLEVGVQVPESSISGEKSTSTDSKLTIIGEETVIVRKPQMDRSQLKVDPAASKPIIDEDLNLDEMFEWCAQNSSFRRWLIEFVKKVMPGFEGKYHRFSKEEMNKVFMQKRKEAAHKIKSFDKNARNYQKVMNEYREKLEKIKNE